MKSADNFVVVALALSSALSFQQQQSMVVAAADMELQWVPRMSYDVTTGELMGRHHPIVFANETHAFLLGGSTGYSAAANDFYIYEEATDQWIDMTAAASVFPPRSFGYGVVLNQANHPKAYLGFGAGHDGDRLNDWWEFDMTTLVFKELASCPGEGRRHPSMVPVYNVVDDKWQIHVGLGDGYVGEDLDFSNFNDYWSYDIDSDEWTQLPNFPSSQRHHPFFFGLGDTSYTGLGHSNGFDPYIERDFYSYHSTTTAGGGTGWTREPDFASYLMDDSSSQPTLETTEARVAGTEFSIDLPLIGATNPKLEGAIGFVLSGDGDDHRSMPLGEFHAFYPPNSPLLPSGSDVRWRQLTPHPGGSRWAPASFVMRGTARAYFTSGYDRVTTILHSDVWMIDLSPLFRSVSSSATTETSPVDTNPTKPETVMDVIMRTDDHTSLLAALKASELDKILTTRGPFTVFAPSDAAFEDLGNETIAKLLGDSEWKLHLTDLLSYHVIVEQRIKLKHLELGMMTEMGNGEKTNITSLVPPRINQAGIQSVNMAARNGVVHGIDSVLLPSWVGVNVVEAMSASPEIFGTLTDLVVAANLTDILSDEGPYTVFAPTKEAFEAALDNETLAFLLSPNGTDALVDILSYHVYPGIVTSQDLEDEVELVMANGGSIQITVERTSGTGTTGGNTTDYSAENTTDTEADDVAVSAAEPVEIYMIGDAKISSGDILVVNGVIHVIDAVLFPDR